MSHPHRLPRPKGNEQDVVRNDKLTAGPEQFEAGKKDDKKDKRGEEKK